MMWTVRCSVLALVMAMGAGGPLSDSLGDEAAVNNSELPAARVFAPRRRLVDVFQAGDYITYTVTSSVNADRSYALTLHTKESWTGLRTEVEEAAKAAAAAAADADADRQVQQAKLQELMAQQRVAMDNAEREELMREIAQLRNAVNRGRPAAAAFGRASSRQSFARVTEVGEDFIALSDEQREVFVPIVRVSMVTRSLEVRGEE